MSRQVAETAKRYAADLRSSFPLSGTTPATKEDLACVCDLIAKLAGDTARATDPRLNDPHWVPGH